MITFRSVGHFFAKAFKEAGVVITDAVKYFPIIEGVTQAVAPSAVPLEQAGCAILGEVASVISSGGETTLLNAGFDAKMIALVKELMAQIPELTKMAAKL